MKTSHHVTALSAALLCLLAAGCTPGTDGGSGTTADTGAGTFIGRKAAQALGKAGERLKTENIRLDGGFQVNVGGQEFGSPKDRDLPRAEITPDGGLLVEGEAVEVSEDQRALLRTHRRQLEDVALAGMAVGARGADIAGTALTGIGEALFGGEEGRKAYETRIEAEAEKIKEDAFRICALLPGLYDSQQALAGALPAFAPYATMTRADIDDCGKDARKATPADGGIKA